MISKEMVIKEIFNYLQAFMIESNWIAIGIPEQARSLFTTFCLMGNINPNTSICDNMLLKLYNDSDMESIHVSYYDFNLYMCELLHSS